MIMENPLRETEPHIDEFPMKLSKDAFRDLYISNGVNNDLFLDTDHQSIHRTNSNNSQNLESSQFETILPSCRTGISILMELPLKIMNGVSEMLNFQSQSPDSEIPAKRPYSPRPHHTKHAQTDVARGRGRGRGRSQLRRSGVSQTRHRQERIRQRLSADIQDDLNGLKEFEDPENDDDPLSTPSVDENGRTLRYSANGVETETGSSKFPFSFIYCDLKRRKRNQQNKNNHQDRMSISTNCKVRYVPECPIDITTCKRNDNVEDIESEMKMSRKRLQSDRSVDSEDSCCIVFETGSESEFETDYDYTTSEDEEDDEDNGDQRPKLKVRFSPHPTIHTMVTWDYAYRAARRGPWEQIARDRARFKSRINCIAQVLNPILVPQHRFEVWQRRFAVEI